MFDDDDGFSAMEAMEAGAAYALYRHGQDRQTETITNLAQQIMAQQQRDSDYANGRSVDPIEVDLHIHLDEEDLHPPVINAVDYSSVDMPAYWDDYIGQEPLKNQLMVYMKAAKLRGERLPHILLASGMAGVGKTSMGRLIAKTMGVSLIELVPPFTIYTLVEAAKKLKDHDIVFIDEIHRLADSGKRGAEILLKILEDGVAFLPDGTVSELPDITIIGATTDRDKLPETVLDRFKIKPYFQAYALHELAAIAIQFAWKHGANDFDNHGQKVTLVDPPMAVRIAAACRNTPRIIEELVLAQRDLSLSLGRPATPTELLNFVEVELDGLTRTHIHYLTAMRQYFARMTKDEEVEYIVGEAAIMQLLRETKQGIQRVEAFLVERGMIDRTPRGRRLTERGIQRAEEFIRAGKGAADVA